MAIRTKTTTRRINGQRISCFERRDGVQRTEYVGIDPVTHDCAYGTIFKSKWDRSVIARLPDGRNHTFAVFEHGATTDQAFAAARTWLVGTAQCEKA